MENSVHDFLQPVQSDVIPITPVLDLVRLIEGDGWIQLGYLERRWS